MYAPRTRAAGGASRRKETPVVQEADSAMTLPSQRAQEADVSSEQAVAAPSPTDSWLHLPLERQHHDQRANVYEQFIVSLH